MTRLRFLVAAVVAVFVLALSIVPSQAGAPATTTTVTTTTTTTEPAPAPPVVTLGETGDVIVRSGPQGPCSDAVVQTSEPGFVQVRRAGDLSQETQVVIELSGAATEGWLFGEDLLLATFAPGVDVVTVEIDTSTYRHDEDARDLIATISLPPPASPPFFYDIGDPGTATLQVRYEDADPGCGPPTFTAAPTNTQQAIALGGSLAPLEIIAFPEATYVVVLESGSLPPGITLNADGTFSGTATQEGTFTAVIGACTPAFAAQDPPSSSPGTCSLTRLTVVVGSGRFPATG